MLHEDQTKEDQKNSWTSFTGKNHFKWILEEIISKTDAEYAPQGTKLAVISPQIDVVMLWFKLSPPPLTL